MFGEESMHDVDQLNLADFVALFVGAENYIEMARAAHPDIDCFIVFINGGPPTPGRQ